MLASVNGLANTFAIGHAEEAKKQEDLQRVLLRLQEVEDSLCDPELAPVALEMLPEIEAQISQYRTVKAKPRKVVPSSQVSSETTARKVVPSDQTAPDFRHERITWGLSRLDLDHPRPWLQSEGQATLLDLLARLTEYEKATWAEVEQMKGHHPWQDLSRWEKASFDRAEELQLGESMPWFQFRLSSRGRLLGLRIGSVFHIVWWDKEHEVCLVPLKNT